MSLLASILALVLLTPEAAAPATEAERAPTVAAEPQKPDTSGLAGGPKPALPAAKPPVATAPPPTDIKPTSTSRVTVERPTKVDCKAIGSEQLPACESARARPEAPIGQTAQTSQPPEQKPATDTPAAQPAPSPSAQKQATGEKSAPPQGSLFAALTAYRWWIAGALALLVTALAIGAAILRRGAGHSGTQGAGRTPVSDRPTVYRRDFVLIDGRGRQHRLPGARLTPAAAIGSGAGAALLLSSPGVAETHAVAWVGDGRLWIRPKAGESLVLNDRLVADGKEIISSGDRIRFGAEEFQVLID